MAILAALGAMMVQMAVSRSREYLADETLGRVQRFDLDLRLRPFPQTAWGWIGREDLAYTRAGEYDRELMYYQLDRPRQLALDGRGNLLVSCEHWIGRFDLATGRQMPFGANPVLGWGGTFTDSPFSASAAPGAVSAGPAGRSRATLLPP